MRVDSALPIHWNAAPWTELKSIQALESTAIAASIADAFNYYYKIEKICIYCEAFIIYYYDFIEKAISARCGR